MQQTIPDKKTLRAEAQKTLGEFTLLLSSLQDDHFHRTPFKGSWTPAQTGDHVIKFLGGVAQLKELPAEPTGRYCDDFVEALRLMFLNFDIRMNAPDFVRPADRPADKDLLTRQLSTVSEKVLHLIDEEDLTLLCKGAEFPTIGEMTRLEWIYFAIYHTQRHTRQLKNIMAHLN